MKKTFVALLLLFSRAFGQESLQLDDAINIALKNNLGLQLAKNDVQSNIILNNYGVAGGLPTVTGTATDNEQVTSINQKFSDASRNTQRNNAASNNLNAGITASMLLYNGMRVVATKNRLEQLQSQSEKLLNAQVQNTIAAVMTNYFDIVRQQSYIKTIEQSIDVSKLQLTIIEARQSVGLANNADLFQAQLDLNALQQQKQSQLLIVEQAKTDLLNLLTLKPDSAIAINDTITVNPSLTLENFINNLPQNAEIMAADDQIKINEQIVKETAALRYPSVRVNTGYNYNRNQSAAGFALLNQSRGPFVGFNLSIPIYNGSSFKRQQQVAEINTKNAEIQKETLLRDYTAIAIKNYQAYSNTLTQLETEQNNYGLAQQLLNLVLQRFELREATIVEVRQAQQTFVDAGYRLVNLSFAAKSAEIELQRLANTLQF